MPDAGSSVLDVIPLPLWREKSRINQMNLYDIILEGSMLLSLKLYRQLENHAVSVITIDI